MARHSGNLFAALPASRRRERVSTLLTTGRLRLERIVSRGQQTAPGTWYDQPAREWVVLLTGAARLRFEDERRARVLRPGDWLDIAAHRRHRVEWTDPARATVWLALHDRAPRRRVRRSRR